MADPNRLNVDKLILHHAVTPLWSEKSKADLAQWFSDNGFVRGYGGNPANWSGLINPYTGQRSYSMAHVAGQRVDDTTPDATPDERAAGYRIVELVQDIWGQITWNAANWPVNQSCIGLENLGDYRNYPLRDGDMRVIADFWRPRDQQLGGASSIFGHEEVAQIQTECPARIMEARDQIVAYVNNPPQPAPQPTPQPAAPTPAPTPTPAPVNPYTRFPSPMTLVANKQPTNAFDLSKTTWADLGAAVVKQLNKGDQFVAVGKYQHPLGGVYFMTDYSFGKADVTGTPDHTFGVNTVDLSPATPAPAPVESVTPPTETPTPVTPPVEDKPTVTPVGTPKENPDGSINVPVKVIPPDPNKWQQSFGYQGAGDYIATEDVVVTDLAGQHAAVKLLKDQPVKIGGTFEKDGVTYYRTEASLNAGVWYGIPEKQDSLDTLKEDDSIFNDIFTSEKDAAVAEIGAIRAGLIKFFASIIGHLSKNH